MEILGFNNAGQWEILEKGSLQRKIGKPKQQDYQMFADDAYDPITDEATKKRGQLELLKKLMNDNSNLNTKKIDGKIHVLLHRGIINADDDNIRRSPMKIHDDGSLSHSKHGMYTDSYGYAKEFANPSSTQEDSPKGKVHSVWVPLDKVNSNARWLQGGAEAKLRAQNPDEAAALDDAGYGEVMNRGNHILVEPGHYGHATPDEVNMHLSPKAVKQTVREPALGSGNINEGSATGEGEAKDKKWQGSDPRHGSVYTNKNTTRAGQPIDIPNIDSDKPRSYTAGVSDLGYDRVVDGLPVKLPKNQPKM